MGIVFEVRGQLLIAMVLAMSSQACATLFRASTDTITFSTEPEDAEVYVEGEPIGRTPLTAELTAKHRYRIEFKKQGYQTEGRYLMPSPETKWVLLDALLGGLTAVLIDAISGKWNGLSPTELRIALVPLAEAKAERRDAVPAKVEPLVLPSETATIATSTRAREAERTPEEKPLPREPDDADEPGSRPLVRSSVEPPAAEGGGYFTAVVAVFEIRDATKSIPEIQLGLLTEYLEMRLAEVGRRALVPRKRIRDETRRKSCADEACRIALGRALRAHEALSVEIVRSNDRCVVQAVLHRLIAGGEDRSAAVDTDCTLDALFGATDEVARRLVRSQ